MRRQRVHTCVRVQATANKPPPSDDTNDNGLLVDLNETPKTPPVVKDDDAAQSTSSTFYVSKDGQLNEHSWRLPSPAGSGSPSTVIGASESLAAEMLDVVMGTEPQQQPRLFATLENVGDELRPKLHVRSPLKLPALPAAFTGGRAPKSCDSCKQVRARSHAHEMIFADDGCGEHAERSLL